MGRPKKIKEAAPAGLPLTATSVEVIPSIEVVGQINAFKALFEGDSAKLPILKSVGYCHMAGTNTYVAYTITSKGGQILKIECEEPNLKAIAEESAKIFFVSNFMAGDENASA